MDEFERQHMTCDAIVLERAIRVLERRFGEKLPVPEVRAYLFNSAMWLHAQAGKGAESVG